MSRQQVDGSGRRRFVDVDGDVQAFPLMYQTGDGSANEHPELTALKSIQEREHNEKHPSEVLDVNDDFNYYKYGWMKESSEANQENYAVFGTINGLSVAIVYFFAGTKLLRFLQFFLLKKKYEGLTFKVSLAPE